jgi:hypothetical protein
MNSILGSDKVVILNWGLFAITGITAYVLLSMFGHLGGGSGSSALGAALAAFKPIPFLLLIVGNVLWGVAVFFGLQNTRYAITATVALGVITSFLYSVIALDNAVNWVRLIGVALVLSGIYFLK